MDLKYPKLDVKTEKFPAAQLFFLALCRIAEPVALTSVFPYAYDMMKHMEGTVAENAAFFGGVFIAVFSLAESMTSFWWASLSDRIGRKPVLLMGCTGTLISLVVMGFSTNIWVAILGRAFGGGLNGNIGVVQTMVGELVKNPKHEPRAYAIMPFFFTIGCTLGPAIGGCFARPAEAFPRIFGKIDLFIKFPYLLPNLVCAAMLLVTIVIAVTLLEETHPKMKRKRESAGKPSESRVTTPLLDDASSIKTQISYGAVPETHVEPSLKADPSLKITFETWNLILAYSLLTGHTITYAQLLPIFLQTPHDNSVPPRYLGGVGGLNLPLSKIGQVMGIGGIISLAVQSLLYPPCTALFDIWFLFAFVTTLHPLAYFLLPYVAFITSGLWREIAFYTMLSLRTIFAVFAFPLILVFLKRATPHHSMLGRVNGLVASSGAAFRTVGPPAAGLLQTFGEKHHLSALAWWGSGAVALVAAVQCWVIIYQARRK